MLIAAATGFGAPSLVLAQQPIPEQFVGIWATANSVLVGETLWGGEALYIDASGDGALVTAPLPVRKCGQNVCEPSAGIKARVTMSGDGHALLVTLLNGAPDAEQMPTVIASASGPILEFQSRTGQHLRLERRTNSISPAMREGLHLNTP